VPKTLEAVLLHQIDLLDSRVGGFMDHVGNDGGGEPWTAKRSEMFGTDLRRPEGFERLGVADGPRAAGSSPDLPGIQKQRDR
jgi:hypothetical protein